MRMEYCGRCAHYDEEEGKCKVPDEEIDMDEEPAFECDYYELGLCPYCEQRFESEEDLIDHALEEHFDEFCEYIDSYYIDDFHEWAYERYFDEYCEELLEDTDVPREWLENAF